MDRLVAQELVPLTYPKQESSISYAAGVDVVGHVGCLCELWQGCDLWCLVLRGLLSGESVLWCRGDRMFIQDGKC